MNDFLLLSNGQRLEHTHRAEISQCPAATISKVSSSCSGERLSSSLILSLSFLTNELNFIVFKLWIDSGGKEGKKKTSFGTLVWVGT
jgi:hypothetical protein